MPPYPFISPSICIKRRSVDRARNEFGRKKGPETMTYFQSLFPKCLEVGSLIFVLAAILYRLMNANGLLRGNPAISQNTHLNTFSRGVDPTRQSSLDPRPDPAGPEILALCDLITIRARPRASTDALYSFRILPDSWVSVAEFFRDGWRKSRWPCLGNKIGHACNILEDGY